MTDSEKLDLLLVEMQGMKGDISGLKGDVQGLKEDVQALKEDSRSMKQRMDSLELQLQTTERSLRNEIRKSEALILDEVERVHLILERHMNDTARHTA